MDEHKMDEDKINLLTTHLPYEHTMLNWAYNRLIDMSKATVEADQAIYNACFECFWLHARNLIEFYSKDKTHDASASFYTSSYLDPNFKQKKGDPAEKNLGKEFAQLINEQICHLKYSRVSKLDEKLGAYDPKYVKEQIDRALTKFESQLTNEAKKHWISLVDTQASSGPKPLFNESAVSTTNHITLVGYKS